MLSLESPSQPPIHFLRASVGFTTRDCATQLSKSQAGVRFFGLAAALVASLGPFEGGNALEQILNSSASDKTLLSTARQLMFLLETLEPRLGHSGFADSLAGWVILLCNSSLITQEHRKSWKIATSFPKPKGVDGLVNAFRQIARIGDSDVIRVSIKATRCTPWVVAFTKWCLGAPPSIFLDDGTIILQQPGTQVEVLASLDDENCPGIEVSIYRALGAPSDLVSALSGSEAWTGMVSIKTYGQWMLHNFEFAEGPANQAFMQALPYALKKVVESLRFSKYREFDISLPLRDWRHHSLQDGLVIDEKFMGLRLSPFGNETTIVNTVLRMLDVSASFQLHSLDGLYIEDLPVVKLHLKTIKGQCLCSVCNPSSGKNFRRCEKTRFFHHLAFVCADILAFSLFQGPDAPLVQLQHYRDGSYPFKKSIYSILFDEYHNDTRISDVLQYTLDLVGHKVIDDVKESRWVMSCHKGQAIYPLLYESSLYEKQSYLTLAWAFGLLRYRGEVYTRVVGDANTSSSGRDPVTGLGGEVTGPCNLLPEIKVIWHVEQAENFLRVSLGLQSGDRDLSPIRYPVNHILDNLASAIMLEACSHSPDAALEQPDKFCEYIGPMTIMPYYKHKHGIHVIGIVAVEGSNELRFFSLSGAGVIMPMVLRKDACLSCCLDACRRTKYPVIIL